VIVSDSTTLIVLMETRRWDLLGNLFSRIWIPRAVYEEVLFKDEKRLPSFLEVHEVEDDATLQTLRLLLDRGESEAIALAMQLGRPLIIDEKKGRKIARRYGVEIMGLLGIVYLNVKKGFLDASAAEDFLQEAKARGFQISERLIARMMQKVKEDR